jgi:hypothetical protein
MGRHQDLISGAQSKCDDGGGKGIGAAGRQGYMVDAEEITVALLEALALATLVVAEQPPAANHSRNCFYLFIADGVHGWLLRLVEVEWTTILRLNYQDDDSNQPAHLRSSRSQ